MQAKQIVFPQQREVKVETFELSDTPGPGEVLIENTFGLISPGTELSLFTGSHAAINVETNKWAKYPFKPGYAAVGRALRIGEGVKGIREGDLVISKSKHASHAVAPALKVPEGIDETHAPFAFLGEIAINAAFASQMQIGMDVAVVGQGLIGNLAAQLMQAAGARRTIAIDAIAERLRIANACGLPLTVDAKAEDVPARVAQMTGDRKCDVVVEATGVADVLATAVKLAKPMGKVVLLGSPRGPAQVDLYFGVHAPSVSLVGAHGNHLPQRVFVDAPEMAAVVLDLMAAGRVRVAPLVTKTLPVANAIEAYHGLHTTPSNYLGVLLDLRKW